MSNRVLIVDDSPILRAAMAKVVRLAGIDSQPLEAGDGVEALEVMADEPVDVVLLDLNMPVMNGEAFLEIVRERREFDHVVVVIVSTERNLDRLEHLRSLGVRGFLQKPFEPEALGRLVTNAAEAAA